MSFNSTLYPPEENKIFFIETGTDGNIEPPALIHRITVASVLLPAGIVGALGNALVILSVILSRKLRTSTNVFVVNLAVADFITSVLLPFMSLSLVIDNNPALPHWLCGTTIGLIYICVCCSLYTLASIGMNRLILISKPTHVYKRLFQPRVLLIWISCVWIYSVGIIMVPLAFGQGELGYDESFHLCGGVTSHPNSAVFEGVLVLGLYPVPLLIIIVSYVMLFAHIRLHGRRMLRGGAGDITSSVIIKSTGNKRRIFIISSTPGGAPTSPEQDLSSSDAPPWNKEMAPDITPDIKQPATTYPNHPSPTLGQMREAARKKISKRHLQITKNLFYVVVAFFVCLTPYFVSFVLNAKNAAVLYAAAPIFFNSCVNPFLYATKHPHFREVFKCILSCNLKGVPSPSPFLVSINDVLYGTSGYIRGFMDILRDKCIPPGEQ